MEEDEIKELMDKDEFFEGMEEKIDQVTILKIKKFCRRRT